MKKGVELIADERQKQIDKHGFTGGHHADHPEWYDANQMVDAAQVLSERHNEFINWYPINWDHSWFRRLLDKPYKERLVIAGALIAAEIDRLQEIEKRKTP